ncbi:MAG: MarC family protein [Candidatus Puniceispirillaceae bacterium]
MIAEFISLALIYFAVIDPIGTIPIFLSITENLHHKQKQWIALRGSFVAFCVLMFFGLFGSFILTHLKISADTFNIAGGAILFIIALEMVNGRRQARKSKAAAESVPKEELIRLSSSPLAVPLLAGPAAITSVMIFSDFYNTDALFLNVGSIFFAMLLSALILYTAAWGSKFINLTISTVMSRVVGILLAAIAIQTILNGLNNLGIVNL